MPSTMSKAFEEAQRVRDLEGNDVTGCAWCEAFQWRDWQTVEILRDEGVHCTCQASEAMKDHKGNKSEKP